MSTLSNNCDYCGESEALLLGRVGFDLVKQAVKRLAFSEGSDALVSRKVKLGEVLLCM